MEFVKRTVSVSVFLLLHVLITSGQDCPGTTACYPRVEDLTQSLQTLSVTSTCGNAATYKSFNTSDDRNYTCDTGAHSKEHMTDDAIVNNQVGSFRDPVLNTYWQSVNTVDTVDALPTEQHITVNLTNVFLISEIQLSFTAPETLSSVNTDGRPSTLCIERWSNGVWQPWRYIADNCNLFSDVLSFTGQELDPTQAVCKSYQRNQPEPAQDKNIHLIEFHPSSDYTQFFSNRTLMDHFSTSAIRVALTRPASMDPPRSYYAVADLKVDGQCLCYGHASSCNVTDVNQRVCVCGHNTMGTNCEKCKPLYNNKPWNVNTACELCNCNTHAGACKYDVAKGHGICTDCINNTRGDNCNDCDLGYFINPSQVTNATVTPKPAGTECTGHNGLGDVTYDCNRYCIACDCDGKGTVPDSNFYCNTTTGQCVCKDHVQGRKCNECKDTYHSLSTSNRLGCTECSCDPQGTFNSSNFCSKDTGECICKNNTQGTRCESCKPETYGLTSDNVVDGCTLCNCDKGGSTNYNCEVNTGQCSCRNRLNGRDCSQVEEGYFVPKLDYFTFDAEFAVLSGDSIVEEPGQGQLTSNVTGLGYVELQPGDSFTFEAELPVGITRPFEVIIRYKSTAISVTVSVNIAMRNGVQYTCDGMTYSPTRTWTENLTLSGPDNKSHKPLSVRVCMKDQQIYTITVTSLAENTNNVQIDSVVLLPDITKLSAFVSSPGDVQTQMTLCRDVSKNVDLEQRASFNCSKLEYSLMAEVFNGAIGCSCNITGTLPGRSLSCDPYGGQCNCRDSIIMRDCSLCQVDSYGGSAGTGCIACDCHPPGSVNAFCNNTGYCDCKTNITGIKCSECLPENFGLQTGSGCTLCRCNGDYSYNNSCADDGQCHCKPGVGGLLCDVCLDGFYNLSVNGCTPCGCDGDGSDSTPCTKDTGICTCKTNVQGDKCSLCKQGYFGLGNWSVDGCLKCECSGHSINCTTAEGWYTTETESHWPLTDQELASGARWLGQDEQGNDITVDDPTVFSDTSDPFAQYVMRLLNNAGNLNRTHMYFLAPKKFLGNKRTAYGRRLTIELRVSSNESMMGPFTEGDVILKGLYLGYSLTRNFATPPTVQKTMYEIVMDQKGWFVNSTEGNPATYEQMIQTLSALEAFKIRGKFSNTTDAEVDLYRIIMEHAARDNSSAGAIPINNVEHCYCPNIYRGDFCELCGFGYRRTKSFSGVQGVCQSCDCNSHAGGPCNIESGICNCTHNTTGDHCELCLPGFYGNAQSGQPDDCKPCTCPGNVVAGDVNVFSLECSLDPATDTPVCINCTTGYGGNMCNECVLGYYGQPTNITNNNGLCTPCVCNKRADICDQVTGVCVNCRDNTTGKECSECAPFYYGDPATAPCQSCTCSASLGATGECDHRNGRCTCKPNVEGFDCNTCAPLSFNFTSGNGCTQCNCHDLGSTGKECDVITGSCDCRNNVGGRQCDTCNDGFWNLKVTGCEPCRCTPEGIDSASDSKCEQVSGQCQCKNRATIGRTCNTCAQAWQGDYKNISQFSVSVYPNCTICGECFDGWAEKLDVIGSEIYSQFEEVNIIWQNYAKWLPSQAEPILKSITTNISLAESSIHRAGNFTQLLSTLKGQLEQISKRARGINADTVSLQQQYNTTNEIYQSITTFMGTVAIDNTTTVSLKDLETRVKEEAMMIEDRYKAGNTSWQNVLGLSILVGNSGDKSRELQARVDAAMRDLAVAIETYTQMVRIYNESFLSGFSNNENALNTSEGIILTARGRLEDFRTIRSTVSNQFLLADSMMKSINNQTSNQQDQMAVVSRLSSYINTLATEVLVAARDTLNIVNDFLTQAKNSRDNIAASLRDVILGINTLRDIETKLTEAEGKVNSILAITLRPLSEMTTLTGEISSTVIPTTIVEETNQKADTALLTAQTAMNHTFKAREDSLRAKEEVEGIQTSQAEANTTRVEAMTLKSDSDNKNQTVNRVLALVQSNSNEVSSLATSTVNSINSLSRFTDTIHQCHQSLVVDAQSTKTDAQNALDKAKDAERSAAQVEPLITSITNKSGTNLTSALRSIEDTVSQLTSVQSSFGRAEGVTNLQAVLDNFGAQWQEIQQLEQETDSLEKDLNDIISELNTRVMSDTSQCVVN